MKIPFTATKTLTSLFLFELFLLLYIGTAFAHIEVGKRVFPSPLTVGNAGISSEFAKIVPSFVPGERENIFRVDHAFSLQLTRKLGVEFEGSLVWTDPKYSSKQFGFGNTRGLLKYAAFENPHREWMITGVLGVEIPFGSERVGAGEDWSLLGGFYTARGLGDLPGSLALLRPVMVMADLMAHHPFTRDPSSAPDRLSYGLGFYYSLPYLRGEIFGRGSGGGWTGFYPMIEWNVTQETNGPDSGRKEILVIPGIQWMGKSVQVGLGVVLQANATSRERSDIGVIGMIGFFEDFYPPFLRKPLFGSNRILSGR